MRCTGASARMRSYTGYGSCSASAPRSSIGFSKTGMRTGSIRVPAPSIGGNEVEGQLRPGTLLLDRARRVPAAHSAEKIRMEILTVREVSLDVRCEEAWVDAARRVVGGT